MRLEHRGVIIPKALEYGDCLDEVSFTRMQDTEQKPHTGRVGLTLQQRLEQLARFRITFLSDQGERVLDRASGERAGPHHRGQHPASEHCAPEPSRRLGVSSLVAADNRWA